MTFLIKLSLAVYMPIIRFTIASDFDFFIFGFLVVEEFGQVN